MAKAFVNARYEGLTQTKDFNLSFQFVLFMDRRFLLVVALVSMFSGVAVFLYQQNARSLPPSSVQVSDVKLGFTVLPFASPALNLTLKNLHSASLTEVGAEFDGKGFDSFSLRVPPGQGEAISYPLQGLNLASHKTYTFTLSFTFADGKFTAYNGSYTTSEFRGQIKIIDVGLVLPIRPAMFSIVISNTGNLPITKATFLLANKYSGQFGTLSNEPVSSFNPLMPGQLSSAGLDLLFPKEFSLGETYPVTVGISYIDGESSKILATVVCAVCACEREGI